MDEIQPYFGADILGMTKDQTTFLSSFARVATDDGKKDRNEVQIYIDITESIPGFENLNAQVLWGAFLALSRIDVKTRNGLLYGELAIQRFFEDESVYDIVTRLTPIKKDGKDTETSVMNLQEKMKGQLYRYVRLILSSDIKL